MSLERAAAALLACGMAATATASIMSAVTRTNVRLASMPYRTALPGLLAARSLIGTGVEVGVQRGLYSEVILSRSRLTELILVDPWRELDTADYRDIANVSQAEHENAFAEAQRRLERFGDRATFCRTTSLEAAARIADASLDFVYLDARHDYEHVMKDLTAWHPKVQPAGILAGHDYLDGEFWEGVFGVRSAVDEFAAAHGLAVYDTYGDRPWSTWIVAPRTRHHRWIAAMRAGLWFGFRAGRKVGLLGANKPESSTQ